MLTRLTRTATTLTLTAGMLAAAPIAQAQDIDFSEMTPEQTEAFGAQVRAYLMENPEVIMEAVSQLGHLLLQRHELDIDCVGRHVVRPWWEQWWGHHHKHLWL